MKKQTTIIGNGAPAPELNGKMYYDIKSGDYYYYKDGKWFLEGETKEEPAVEVIAEAPHCTEEGCPIPEDPVVPLEGTPKKKSTRKSTKKEAK